MVWKIKRVFACMCLAVALCVSMATQAHAYSVYDGTISTSYLTYFRDTLSKIPVSSDYVFFRSGQNEYTLAYGELELLGGTFTGENVTIIQYYSTGNYNANYTFTTTTERNFSLDALATMVYSNLGNYPALEERGDIVGLSTLFVLGSFVLACFVHGIFKWTYRSRNGN